MSSSSWNSSLLPELLPIYYKKLFPFSQFYRWLRYKNSGQNYFKNREFSFTLADDVYVRYRSYVDQADMEKDIRTKCPEKIDIGPVYTCSPKMRDMVRAGEFVAQYKELVFDIDMTDYDDVRFCCSGADICMKCWPLMIAAIKILHRALTEDFGFQHILWVYSGRRGVHCWVCDAKARKLSSAARSAIADYLSVVKGGSSMKKKVILKYNNPHPSIAKAVDIIADMFEDYVIKQDLLSTPDRYNALKELITDANVRANLEEAERKVKGMEETTKLRWETIKQCFIITMGNPPHEVCVSASLHDMPNSMKEIMLQYMYPRLDVNVSKGLNHLLKSPFCVHPKTGRVCVPIDIEHVDKFNPFKVPTLNELTQQLGDWSGDGNILPYKKTGLRSYIEVFDAFTKSLPGSDVASEETSLPDNKFGEGVLSF